jgi:hypothetical protein
MNDLYSSILRQCLKLRRIALALYSISVEGIFEELEPADLNNTRICVIGFVLVACQKPVLDALSRH